MTEFTRASYKLDPHTGTYIRSTPILFASLQPLYRYRHAFTMPKRKIQEDTKGPAKKIKTTPKKNKKSGDGEAGKCSQFCSFTLHKAWSGGGGF